ncbi:MAG: VIT1/CCC1 transporter family protein [Nitrososphaeria archaeon]|nr:VIT1/CCC1 transporter family protein [Conexivisphaerales archaeon]
MDLIASFYLDELHDMMLYEKLSKLVKDKEAKERLKELSNVERFHAEFFRKMMNRLSIQVPNPPNNFFISLEALFFYVFGLNLTMKLFEERESATVVNYLKLYDDQRLTNEEKDTLKRVIKDEMEHESFFRTKTESAFLKNIRDILLGINDGLIELLAAVSGFVGAYAVGFLVGIAGIVIGVSGSLSMAVGAYISSKSEGELNENKRLRQLLMSRVFGIPQPDEKEESTAKESAFFVGFSYLVGALIPTLPYFLSLSIRVDQVLSYIFTVIVLALVAFVTSITTGVDYKRKILEMIGLAIAASIVTFSLGVFIHYVLGLKVY